MTLPLISVHSQQPNWALAMPNAPEMCFFLFHSKFSGSSHITKTWALCSYFLLACDNSCVDYHEATWSNGLEKWEDISDFKRWLWWLEWFFSDRLLLSSVDRCTSFLLLQICQSKIQANFSFFNRAKLSPQLLIGSDSANCTNMQFILSTCTSGYTWVWKPCWTVQEL